MMNVRLEIDGEIARFVVETEDADYRYALLDLLYRRTPTANVKEFPSRTPGLMRIYGNFSRNLITMLRQTARLEPAPWDEALAAFADRAAGSELQWYLVGSAALAVRGIDVAPRDIDLVVDDAPLAAHLLNHELVEPVVESKGWISDWFGRAFLHTRIEWVGGIDPKIDERIGANEYGAAAQARLETVRWRGHDLSVPPLDIQLEVTENRKLEERAAKIRAFTGGRNGSQT